MGLSSLIKINYNKLYKVGLVLTKSAFTMKVTCIQYIHYIVNIVQIQSKPWINSSLSHAIITKIFYDVNMVAESRKLKERVFLLMNTHEYCTQTNNCSGEIL
jgi:hypothetical protein